MKLCFEKEKEALASICTNPVWDVQSGEEEKELRGSLLQIEKEVLYTGGSRMAAKAKMIEYVLEHGRLSVHPFDLFPDRINHDNLILRIRDRWIRTLRREEMAEALAEDEAGQRGLCYTGNIDLGHTSPDWDAILTLGIPGLLTRVQNAHDAGGISAEQEEFYTCTEEVLTAVLRFIERLSFAAGESGGPRAAEIAASLLSLTEGAPTTMLSAMQLIMIFYNLQTNVEGEAIRSLGGLDRMLCPFYRRDVARGILTEADARQMLRYFYWKLYSMKVTANVPFYICGRTADGKSAVNEMTYMIVEEYTAMDIDDPKIHVLWTPETDEALLRKVLASIRDGKSSFVLLNCDVVEESLRKNGASATDARNFTVIGCYEPCALGREIPCTVAGRVNLPKAVLTVIHGGEDLYTGARIGNVREDVDSYRSFDEFYQAVKAQIGYFADRSMALIRSYEKYYPYVSQSPLLSSTFRDCVDCGRDAYDGGARYNNSSVCAISIAAATDALTVVRELVFKEKAMRLSELGDILRKNWQGEEALRHKVMTQYPKYGNGDAQTDAMAADLIRFVAERINGKPNGRGGVFRTGLFSIDWRIVFGERTGATADGRLAGEMLSKNMSACTAMDKQGVTASVLSATAIDYTDVPDGAVLDLMFHSGAVEGEDGITAMLSIINVYMARGGFAVQMNVFSPEVLRAAQAEPEKYSTLQVRLCGWNVYFVALDKAEQDELIRQSENTVRA